MKQYVTEGIVLSRINFGEADRIITVLTKDYGKVRLLAKGVRKVKSRLAGGIELFSVNDITFLEGRGGLGTLISSRLKVNHGNIIKNIDRTMYAYEVLKSINKITQDSPEDEYFYVLSIALGSMDSSVIKIEFIKLWFAMQMLVLNGCEPNMFNDVEGNKLSEGVRYSFDYDDMVFNRDDQGPFTSRHIKLLRISKDVSPERLSLVNDGLSLTSNLIPFVEVLVKQRIR